MAHVLERTTTNHSFGFENVAPAGIVFFEGPSGALSFRTYTGSYYGNGEVITKPKGTNLVMVATGKFFYGDWGFITSDANTPVTATIDPRGRIQIDYNIGTSKVAHFQSNYDAYGNLFGLNKTVFANITWKAV